MCVCKYMYISVSDFLKGKQINKKYIDIMYDLFRTEYANIIWFSNWKDCFNILTNKAEVLYVQVPVYLYTSSKGCRTLSHEQSANIYTPYWLIPNTTQVEHVCYLLLDDVKITMRNIYRAKSILIRGHI